MEVHLNWNSWIRQFHRWVSIAFTLTVIANFVVMGMNGGQQPPAYVTYSPLLPLALLLFSGCTCSRCRMSPDSAAGEGVSHQHEKKSDAATADRDWRGDLLARIRALIEQADPDMIEERKWRKPSNGMAGVPVWSHDGIVCTGETYKNAVKMTFARAPS